MNKKFFAILYACTILASHLSTGEPAKQPQTIKVPMPANPTSLSLTFNVNNYQDSQSNNSTQVSNMQLEQTKNESPLLKKLSNALPDHPWQSLKNSINESHFFDRYKWYALSATVLAAYGALCYLVVSGNAYLGRNDLWSSWRQELPLDQLLAIPQSQFAQELLQEMQRRYSDPTSLLDLEKPLALFIQTIEKEEEQIKSYQSYYSWFSYLYLLKIVPFSKNRFVHIPQRLQRIAYYKNVFYSWAAQYQLEHANRCQMHTEILTIDYDLVLMADRMKHTIITNMKDYWETQCIPPFC